MIRYPRNRSRSLAMVRRHIERERPEVICRASFRIVHSDKHVCWVESSYLDPPNTIPPLCRLFTVQHNEDTVTEKPFEDIVQFEWWAKAPIEYAKEQRRRREAEGA